MAFPRKICQFGYMNIFMSLKDNTSKYFPPFIEYYFIVYFSMNLKEFKSRKTVDYRILDSCNTDIKSNTQHHSGKLFFNIKQLILDLIHRQTDPFT